MTQVPSFLSTEPYRSECYERHGLPVSFSHLERLANMAGGEFRSSSSMPHFRAEKTDTERHLSPKLIAPLEIDISNSVNSWIIWLKVLVTKQTQKSTNFNSYIFFLFFFCFKCCINIGICLLIEHHQLWYNSPS